jgi:uncharacterized protein
VRARLTGRLFGLAGRTPRRWILVTATACVIVPLVSWISGPAVAQSQSPSSPTPWPGGVWQPDVATYGMTVQANVPITMDDGVVLTANVGYPTDLASGQRADGKFPVLLTQDPYTFATQPDPYYVDRGYIFVTAETRGTGTSGGDFGFFSARDAKDGVALVNWVAHQLPGSNGTVGLTGCSFLGISQMFTAAAVGPNSPIKAIVPACTGHQYDGLYFVGGIGSQNAAQFAAGGSAAIFGTANLAQTTQFLGAVGTSITNGGDDAYNRQFWQQRTSSNAAAGVVRNGIPALLWSGWQAEDLIGGLETYTMFQNAFDHRPLSGPMDVRQPASGRYQMIVGNGSHGQGLDEGIELEWYDTWLKGQRTNIKDTATPLHLFEQGSNRWVNAATLPMDARYSPYYLNDGGAMTSTPSKARGGSDPIVWAPPTTAGATLTYTTKPLAKGATLAGPIDASVYASSSNANLELIADLYDVAPDGTSTRVTTGDILGSLSSLDKVSSWYDDNNVLIFPAHPYLADHYVPAGQVRRYDMWLYPRLYSLAPGHALRLVLSTQAAADSCNGSGVPLSTLPQPCFLTAPQKQTLPGGAYQIDHSRLQPSSINLPLLPYGVFATASSGVTPTSKGAVESLDWGPPAHPRGHHR